MNKYKPITRKITIQKIIDFSDAVYGKLTFNKTSINNVKSLTKLYTNLN